MFHYTVGITSACRAEFCLRLSCWRADGARVAAPAVERCGAGREPRCGPAGVLLGCKRGRSDAPAVAPDDAAKILRRTLVM